jgi:hypothetical protein
MTGSRALMGAFTGGVREQVVPVVALGPLNTSSSGRQLFAPVQWQVPSQQPVPQFAVQGALSNTFNQLVTLVEGRRRLFGDGGRRAAEEEAVAEKPVLAAAYRQGGRRLLQDLRRPNGVAEAEGEAEEAPLPPLPRGWPRGGPGENSFILLIRSPAPQNLHKKAVNLEGSSTVLCYQS